MTWNGLQGFQTPIANDSFIVDGIGALGRTHTERGLTYYEVALCGHMCVHHMLYIYEIVITSYLPHVFFFQGT
jgi:hypothetical protein